MHRSRAVLEAGLKDILDSPKAEGVLRMIVRRPAEGLREILEQGELHVEQGLVGDNWRARGSSRTRDGAAHPDMQLNVMNSRAIALIAGTEERWPLAGDQLLVELDLSTDNLPAGTRLTVGSAVIEVTSQPHTGCRKFVERFGLDAMKFVSSPTGRRLNLRGVCARVMVPGIVRPGDLVRICRERGAPSPGERISRPG